LRKPSSSRRPRLPVFILLHQSPSSSSSNPRPLLPATADVSAVIPTLGLLIRK
ncbi:unnamed protein product, partial [Citrullus colocynthis]